MWLKVILIIFITFNFLFAKELDKVTLQFQWKHQFEFAGFYAAKHKGYYKEAGFDVEFIEHSDGLNQVAEVVQGRKTFGIWGTGLISSAIKGEPIVFLANYFKRSPLVLLTQKDIALPSDLSGKKLMISQMDFKDPGLLNMLNKFNVDPNNIKVVSPTYDINDFIDKKVDAYLAFLTNEPYFLQEKRVPYNVLDPNNYGVEQYDINLFTSKKYAAKNPDKTKAFIEASNKGWEYALNNKEEIVKLILDEYNTQNKSKESLIFEANEIEKIMFPKIYPIGSIQKDKVRKIAELYVQYNDNKDYDTKLQDFIFEDGLKSIYTKEELEFIKNNNIKCVTNSSWSPFNMLDRNKELAGISIDYWNLIQEKSGLKSTCEIIKKWPEVLNSIKNDKADITLSTTKTKEREEYAVFTKPYVSFPLALATRNDFQYISDFSAVKSLIVAVGKNTSAYKLLLENYPEIDLITVDGIDKALELLSTGEVDAAVEILPVLAYKMNNSNYSNLKISGNSSFSFDVMMMINDDKKILASIINKAIDNISDDEKQNIYNKWISVKFEKGFDYDLIFKIVAGFIVLNFLMYYRYRIVVRHRKELNQKNKELEESKRQLKESNDRLQMAAKVSFDLLYEWDVKTNTLTWYGDIDRFLGYEKGEVSKDYDSWFRLLSKEDQTKLNELIDKRENSNDELFLEYRIKEKSGIYQDWKDHSHVVLDENNNPIKWIGVCTDVSESVRLNNELIEKSKLAALGEMIGNIAHQWRQPLSIISTVATGIKFNKQFGNLSDELLIESCDTINHNTQFLSNTIDDFRDFIKGERTNVTVNLSKNIKSFLKLVEGSINNHNLTIVKSLDKDIILNGYPNELLQCYINLFNNAKDALSEEKNEKLIFINTSINRENVVISFKDNGGGISDEVLPHIFEPYFTTKHKSKGTGLGLSMTYNLIVQGMNGKIEVSNVSYTYEEKEYVGAEFKIILPINTSKL